MKKQEAKAILEKKSFFESKFLEKITINLISTACQILSQLFYHPSGFESETSKIFRFWTNICFRKIKNIRNSWLQKYFLVLVFQSENLKLASSRFFENMVLRHIFLGENLFRIINLKRISFRINFCTTRHFLDPEFLNKLDFKTTSYISSKTEPRFLKRVRFWINLFTTRQILNRNIYNALHFELKIVSNKSNFVRTFSSKKSILARFKTLKSQK